MTSEFLKYYEEGLNDMEIGIKLGVSRSTIANWRRKNGLKSNFTYKDRRKIHEDVLRELINSGLKDREIADILKVKPISVFFARGKYGIKRKSFRYANSIPINQRQLEILTGTLLGDSSLIVSKNCINPRFSCMHGISQKEYCEWKYEELKELGMRLNYSKRISPDKRNGKYYESWNIRGNANTEYLSLYNNLYIGGKKRITVEFLENFSSLSLAVMFMDDGSRSTKGSAFICTHGFLEEDLIILIDFLKQKFDLEFTIQKSGGIYLLKRCFEHFKELVLPHMHDSLIYKLGLVTQ